MRLARIENNAPFMFQNAPQEQRRRQSEKWSSKRYAWRVHVALCTPTACSQKKGSCRSSRVSTTASANACFTVPVAHIVNFKEVILSTVFFLNTSVLTNSVQFKARASAFRGSRTPCLVEQASVRTLCGSCSNSLLVGSLRRAHHI